MVIFILKNKQANSGISPIFLPFPNLTNSINCCIKITKMLQLRKINVIIIFYENK